MILGVLEHTIDCLAASTRHFYALVFLDLTNPFESYLRKFRRQKYDSGILKVIGESSFHVVCLRMSREARILRCSERSRINTGSKRRQPIVQPEMRVAAGGAPG